MPRSASLRRWGVRWSVNSVPPPSRALTATCGYRKLSAGLACGENRRRSKVTGQRPITNVVMMGMGEPLLNLNNVVPAMEIMLDDFGFGLSKRRVTLSTSGVVPALDKLGDMIDVALAISCTRRTTKFVTKLCRSTKVQYRNVPCCGAPLSGEIQRQSRPSHY